VPPELLLDDEELLELDELEELLLEEEEELLELEELEEELELLREEDELLELEELELLDPVPPSPTQAGVAKVPV
jgi:hypothetical protein